jgi:hypothetical protein
VRIGDHGSVLKIWRYRQISNFSEISSSRNVVHGTRRRSTGAAPENGAMNPHHTSRPKRIPQNVSARESAQIILGLPVPRECDIARLRPDSLPRGDRFETVADARMRRYADIDRFERIQGLEQVVDRLSACSAQSPCAHVYCAICGRLFRRWFAGQALRYQRALDLRVLTVALELVPSTGLTNCNLLGVKRRAAQRLRRTAPSAEFVLGGIEAEYRQGDDTFLVHAHLLVSPLPRDELDALRSAFASIDVARPIKLQKLTDAPRQISYLLKFVTFHRPGSQKGSCRATAIPLPDHALKQLILWRARHGFLDFVFMMHLRRRDGDLVRIDDEKPKYLRTRCLHCLRRLRSHKGKSQHRIHDACSVR